MRGGVRTPPARALPCTPLPPACHLQAELRGAGQACSWSQGYRQPQRERWGAVCGLCRRLCKGFGCSVVVRGCAADVVINHPPHCSPTPKEQGMGTGPSLPRRRAGVGGQTPTVPRVCRTESEDRALPSFTHSTNLTVTAGTQHLGCLVFQKLLRWLCGDYAELKAPIRRGHFAVPTLPRRNWGLGWVLTSPRSHTQHRLELGVFRPVWSPPCPRAALARAWGRAAQGPLHHGLKGRPQWVGETGGRGEGREGGDGVEGAEGEERGERSRPPRLSPWCPQVV